MKIMNIAQAGVITDSPTLSDVALNILQFLLQVFGFVAIIGLVIVGIIYLLSIFSGDERIVAIAKKYLFHSVIGVVVAAGAMIFISQVSKFLQ